MSQSKPQKQTINGIAVDMFSLNYSTQTFEFEIGFKSGVSKKMTIPISNAALVSLASALMRKSVGTTGFIRNTNTEEVKKACIIWNDKNLPEGERLTRAGTPNFGPWMGSQLKYNQARERAYNLLLERLNNDEDSRLKGKIHHATFKKGFNIEEFLNQIPAEDTSQILDAQDKSTIPVDAILKDAHAIGRVTRKGMASASDLELMN